jgi:hypothetical protein
VPPLSVVVDRDCPTVDRAAEVAARYEVVAAEAGAVHAKLYVSTIAVVVERGGRSADVAGLVEVVDADVASYYLRCPRDPVWSWACRLRPPTRSSSHSPSNSRRAHERDAARTGGIVLLCCLRRPCPTSSGSCSRSRSGSGCSSPSGEWIRKAPTTDSPERSVSEAVCRGA